MEFQLLLVLLPSVMHQTQPRIIKSNLIQIKLIQVCYSNSANIKLFQCVISNYCNQR